MSRASERSASMSSDRTDDELLLGSVSNAGEQSALTLNERRSSNQRQSELDRERQERIEELKYGANQVLSLIKPVSITMIVVIFTIKSVGFFTQKGQQMAYAPMREDNENETSGEKFNAAAINVLIILCVLITMTFVLVLLYKYRCYRAIHGWLLLSSLLLLFFFSGLYLFEVLSAHNLALDMLTTAIIVWNFGVGGLMAIHWKGPLIVQQVYLVVISGLMALILIKNLPDYTTWLLLGMVAVYDLFAVLCPGGPLKMLVETAQERDEPLFPALIYSSTMLWFVPLMAGGAKYHKLEEGSGPTESAVDDDRDVNSFQPTANTSNNEAYVDNASPMERNGGREQQEEEEDASGIKLGLGDFIFYSVLVGKAASMSDMGTVAACYVAIIIGLVCTLFILSVFQKALPALPISIAFGLIFYFSTSELMSPFFNQFAMHMTFC